MPSMSLRIGEVFAGYRILRLLGSGGMGEVFLVQHPRLPRQEALKVLRADLSSDQSYRERFVREADLAASLRHPSIVSVYDRGQYNDRLWISMAFIDGIDAARLLGQRYPAGMPVDLVVRIVSAVASALDYAHKKGLLHRDVKPANIIVGDLDTDEPDVQLADFGIARPLDETAGLTTTNMTVGTVAYAAPEQLMGEAIDGRADQYALAATAYHLLSGEQLFPNSNPAVVISRHLNMAPSKVSERRPDCATLDDVLQMALSKDPADRFSSCSAFSQALADQSAHAGVISPSAATRAAPKPLKTAPTTNGKSLLRSGTHSRRGLAILSGVIAILVVLGGVAWAWRPWSRSGESSAAGSVPMSIPAATAPMGITPGPSAPTPQTPTTTVPPSTSSLQTPAASLPRFYGEWGQHSMSVTLAPDGSAYYKVWSGAANGTTWSATWSAIDSTSAMIILNSESESHGEIDYFLDRYPGQAFTFALQSGGYASITTPSGQPLTLCPRGSGFRDVEGLCGA